METKVRRYWPLVVVALYALHGVWLALHVRATEELVTQTFPAGSPGVRFNVVSLLRMLADEAPESILALAGVVMALWRGKGALRVVLVILGLALWAAYAWMPMFLMS